MTYTIANKSQTAIDAYYGGGVRYSLILVSKYANQPARDDHFSSNVIVDRETFDGLSIGDSIKVGITLNEVNDGPIPQTENELIASLKA